MAAIRVSLSGGLNEPVPMSPSLKELVDQLPLRRGSVVGAAFVAPSTDPRVVRCPSHIRPGLLFEAGSLTKTMTATLLAKMVLGGAVKLETTVGELLGAESGAAKDVTLEELATHTSGLPRLAPNAITFPFWPRDPYRFYGRERLGKGLATAVLNERGEIAYSNFGFDLLACCLEAASNQDFASLLRDEVLLPAGLTNARCQPCRRRGLARGHGSLLLGGRRWHQKLAGAGGVDCW